VENPWVTGEFEMTVFMEWKEEFSVENDLYDDQHLNLLRTINQVYDEMDKGNDEEAKKGVKDLYILTQHHILTEERQMRIKDKDFMSHRDDHDRILATLSAGEERFRQGHKVDIDFLNAYKSWFQDHFVCDKEMSAHFRQRKNQPC
jgi:hemerythrin-like metal-binding protein